MTTAHRARGVADVTSAHRHGSTIKVLHWTTAALLITGAAIGLFMVEIPFSPLRVQLLSWHKWIGILLLALAITRIVVRQFGQHGKLSALGQGAIHRVASITHAFMYVLLLLVPLLGWLFSSAAAVPVVLFGVVPLPNLVTADRLLAGQLKVAHQWAAWLLLIVVAGHICAALKHHFLDKDDVLRQMLPRLRRPF